MSYIKRKIDLVIRLGKGSFGESGFDTVTLRGLRVTADIHKTGMPAGCTANIRVYGMRLSLMNQLSRLGKPLTLTRDNTVTVHAGDDTAGMAVVFAGTIIDCWADFQSPPEVFLNMFSVTGDLARVKPVAPTSYGPSTDVVTIMSSLASVMGADFENNGVSGIILSNPYYPGTAAQQAEACAAAAGIGYILDDLAGKLVLAIWPLNRPRRQKQIPIISPATGMVGYPAYTGGGVRLRSLFNPSILFNGLVKVEKSTTTANGLWTINDITHQLTSEEPSGAWFTDMQGYLGDTDPFFAAPL